MSKFTTTEINAFFDAIEAADKAVQVNSKALYAWSKADRATRGAMPRLTNGEDTATVGNVSCKLSPAPQSGRTNASRRNWKIDGKRATEAQVIAALNGM